MITDTEARRIASEWHGGGGTALYAFASTGAINTARDDHDIEAEIADNVWNEEMGYSPPDCASDLRALDAYVKANSDEHGTRGPQPGWSNLSW